MAVTFTLDQQRVIDTRNKNILVSAAAGSGKTAVLVERIIRRIMDPKEPVDIDKMLVVTFTNAAAASMKERISNAIQARLAMEPENTHLQRQAILVHQAQITTIHSFCLYLIKNHFEAIGLTPDFTVADEASVRLLAGEIKEQVLEEAFAEANADFLYMVEFICHNGKESSLEEYMDQLYARAMSMPFPKSWLMERKKDYDFQNLKDFTDTDAGKYLYLHIHGLLKSYEEAYGQLYRIATQPDGPYMYADLLEAEQQYLQRMLKLESLEDISRFLPTMDFGRLPAKKDDSVNAAKKEWVKNKRSAYKKAIQELGAQFFGKGPQSIEVENAACKRVTEALIQITLTYMERLTAEKRRRGLIDFHDMEHMALEILLRETADGFEPTEIACSYREFFEEVMVDEYQDSNMVQEFLVTAVSDIAKSNRFMVGDVKQSIYKFRLARPELFMEKYHLYAGKDTDKNIRIDLKQNFRSRKEVLEATNSVFEKVMLPELGGIAYDEHAALYPGAHYIEAPGMEAELLVVTEDRPEHYDAKEWEAYCVAGRIKELIREGRILDESGNGLRQVTYGDIVLLFRSPTSFEEAYKKVFEEQQIPIFMTSGSGYFDAVEIQNLVKLLQAIENPRLDIPFFGVCTSVFGGMNESQLAKVKVHYKEALHGRDIKKSEQCLYDMLCLYARDFPEDEITVIIKQLQEKLQKYREQMEYLTVAELLYQILRDFHYREYISVLPDGEKRLANVALLLEKATTFGAGSYRGLFAFTSYINQLHKQSIDYGEAGMVEHTDAVRVMSIHKSKGLEFPVAIVCGMGQNYQMRDKQQMILIDNDMGVGMDYVNPLLRSKNKTLRKNVIALKMEQEILAEEQRILYVAMTRAKEKLIMVGYKAKFEGPQMQDFELTLNLAKGTCMLSDVLMAKSYLDLCLLARHEHSPIVIREMTMEDYVVKEITETVSRDERKEWLLTRLKQGSTSVSDMQADEHQLYQTCMEHFAFKYPYDDLKDLYTATSVSELKKAAIKEEQADVHDIFEKEREKELFPYIPPFMQQKVEMSGAERGTAYHRVMELVDFRKPPAKYEEWQQSLEEMVKTGRLSERQKECIYIPILCKFMTSDIARRMRKAAESGLLHKEQSFYLGVPANQVNASFPAKELMLIQGIIDVYFEEDGELVLVDYKTDSVTNGQELVEKYQTQMLYYTKALVQTLDKKVKEVILYSMSLGEEVKLEA
ncbi:MAG: helicase-exonuclease AddAB subunit AddA [Lachnospiraceae bacterium]|nr:helicase-exonuclease AddAB subunit AddA [Lachnospiraceae bacterium]